MTADARVWDVAALERGCAERILRARDGKGRMPKPLSAGVAVPELVEMMTPSDF